MAKELENAFSDGMGEYLEHDALMQAMCNLLVLLLQEYKNKQIHNLEEDSLVNGIKKRTMNYRKPSSLANRLIPSPS